MAKVRPELVLSPDMIEQFGEAFHTGLRKALDTQHSVIAWNSVHAVGDTIWVGFVEHMRKSLNNEREQASRIGAARFAAILENWDAQRVLDPLFKNDNELWKTLAKREPGRRAVSIFSAAMRGMPELDVDEMVRWLNECFPERKAASAT